MIRKIILLFLTLCFSATAQIPTATATTKCSLLTASPGAQLYSIYGHTGLRIYDVQQGFDFVVNFGYFDFSTPNFYLKFVKGDLKYFVGVDNYEDFYSEYVFEQRGIKEQVLQLNPTEIQLIISDLARILNSDEKFYTYKFFNRNCTTMVADLIAKHSKIKPIKIEEIKQYTFREIVSRYQNNLYFENLGINMMFGANTDSKPESIFLPEQLFEAYEKSGKKIVSETIILNKPSLALSIPWWNSIYTLFFVLVTLVLAHPLSRKFLMIIFGILGVFLTVAGLYSNHTEVLWNYNVLLFNPLFLILAFAEKTSEKYRITARALIILAAAHILFVLNKPQLLLFSPIYLAIVLLIWKLDLLSAIKKNGAKSLHNNIHI